jgi:hypothetical protein
MAELYGSGVSPGSFLLSWLKLGRYALYNRVDNSRTKAHAGSYPTLCALLYGGAAQPGLPAKPAALFSIML